MSDLGPEDRALLDLARDDHEPSGADRSRVRALLLQRLGASSGLAGTTAAAAQASTLVGAAKVLAVFAMVGAAGGWTLGTRQPFAAERGPASTQGSGALPPPTVQVAARATGLPAPEAPATAPADTAAPAPPLSLTFPRTFVRNESLRAPGTVAAAPRGWVAAPSFAPRVPGTPLVTVVAEQDPTGAPPGGGTIPETAVRSVPAPSGAIPPAPQLQPPNTLEAESRLVRAGIAALHRGDPHQALALLDEHARSFPRGVLAEERDVERLTALCALQRNEEARRAGAQFLRDHPSSPLRSRAKTSCGGTNNP